MDSVLASSTHSRRTLSPLVAGVDEAGRGCLAGPVVAACVVLPHDAIVDDGKATWLILPSFIRDSKQLSPVQREEACRWIYRHALVVSVGLATVEEIERLNILQATLLAMKRAVVRSSLPLQRALVDGSHVPDGLPCCVEAVVDGDERVPVISAASIVAKVVRDHLMERMHRLFPQYGFAQHKGYGTVQHRRAIEQFGLCPQHRPSFCKKMLRLPLESTCG
ncbi:MAG: ribonuclease HII [Armatimonadota bacterium]|nr:ribonuclease HII [bacterium]MDW8321167.1 ribonuclease HII [Armatimonadota bacterium]